MECKVWGGGELMQSSEVLARMHAVIAVLVDKFGDDGLVELTEDELQQDIDLKIQMKQVERLLVLETTKVSKIVTIDRAIVVPGEAN